MGISTSFFARYMHEHFYWVKNYVQITKTEMSLTFGFIMVDREQEKMHRWEEIKIRQHRLMAEADAQATPSHIDHIMKSGFTMNDIKGLHRNYTEDAVEADEQMLRLNPSRPPRKGSLTRSGSTYGTILDDMQGQMQRSTSALNMDGYLEEPTEPSDKKRGRSPFRFFKKNRDQSKDKIKSKSPEPLDRRATTGRNAPQQSMARAPTVRISDVST